MRRQEGRDFSRAAKKNGQTSFGPLNRYLLSLLIPCPMGSERRRSWHRRRRRLENAPAVPSDSWLLDDSI